MNPVTANIPAQISAGEEFMHRQRVFHAALKSLGFEITHIEPDEYQIKIPKGMSLEDGTQLYTRECVRRMSEKGK